MEEKKALRKHIKSLKGSMDKSDLLAYSHALFSQLERSERFQKAHTGVLVMVRVRGSDID